MINSTYQAIGNPTLWVSDSLAAHHLSCLFLLMEYRQVKEEIAKSEHYVLAERDTPEETIKGIVWRIQSAGYRCKIHTVSASIELKHLAADGRTAQELTVEILDRALDYEDWVAKVDQQTLTIREAAQVATLAIALLPETQKLTELCTLRTRCNESSWNWSKLVRNLEEEFQREIERRQGVKQPADKSERLKMELQTLLQEPDLIKRTLKRSEICGKFSISGKDLEILLNSLSIANNKPKARAYSAEEFRALEPEGISWVIPGLLPKGGLTVFAGAAGVGKSTLAYDVAASVLFGDEFLGETPSSTGKVLFVASDEPQCFVEDKFINRGIYGSDDYNILLDWDISQMDILESWLDDLRPTLVVIDSFSAIHKDPTFDENSAQARRSIEELQRLVNRYNASALLIHHTTKSKDQSGVGKVRGSTAIAAAGSATWILEGEKGSEIRTFTTPKIRGAAPWNVRLTLDAPNGRWEIVGGNEEESTHKTIGDRIIEFMLNCPEAKFEAEEIISAVGYGKQSVYKALDRLVQRGIVIKRPSQNDARRKVYKLANFSTPPSPTTSVKVSTKIAETITPYDLEDSRQILDNYSTDSSQSVEFVPTKITEAVDMTESQEIVDTQHQGEGGGSKDLTEGQPSTSSLNPPSHNFSVGDEVQVLNNPKLKSKRMVISTIDNSGIRVKEPKKGFTPAYGVQAHHLRKC